MHALLAPVERSVARAAEKAARSIVIGLIAGFFALTAFGFLTAGFFILVAERLGAGYAALVVAGAYILCAGVVILIGRGKSPKPAAPAVPEPPLAEAFVAGFQSGRAFGSGFKAGR